ncbi:MAG: carboxyl transferase domain-containing protein [Desulfobacterales bacterium]
MDKINELKTLKEKASQHGGEKAVAKHKEKGKLTARERLTALFDEGTFREVDMFVKHRCVNFGMENIDIPSDGVVTGYGRVAGRPVFAFAQDFTSRAGSLGEMHARKICKIMDMAHKAGAPVVGMNDSGGPGFRKEWMPCADTVTFFTVTPSAPVSSPRFPPLWAPPPAAPVYSPAMTDWIFMVKNTSHMFITGPEVIKSVTGEQITFEDLGGAMTHNEKSGVAHFAL